MYSVLFSTLRTALLLCSFYATAQVQLPAINLGDSSFLDGMGGPGTLLQQTINYHTENTFTAHNGQRLALQGSVESTAGVTLLGHFTEHKI